MGTCFCFGGIKSFLFYIAIVGALGWLSMLQTLQTAVGTASCSSTTRGGGVVYSHLEQEWTAQVQQPSTTATRDGHKGSSFSQRRLRVLLGIFTFDSSLQQPYRRQYRRLFNVFPMYNDTRVCSLHSFQTMPEDVRYNCQLIYTFVVGGLKDTNARTELIDDSAPIVLDGPPDNIRTGDLKENSDVTFLNIQENMNDGKSQTWLKYATNVLEQYDLDYVGKIDSDSLPYLDKFFSYAYNNLPPPPYNNGILAGVPIDKLWWKRTKAEMHQDTNEDFFKDAYGKVMHLYAAGQCYFMSKDLAQVVVLEAPKSTSYREGPEDHDISAMAFHSTKPINFHFLTLQQQFWKHPVKRYQKKVRYWRTLWHNENVRMKKVLELQHLPYKSREDEESGQQQQIPNELAAPVQQELDESEKGEVEEEEEGEDEAAVGR